ncbi:MAG: hypothetical protein QF531_00550 [Candidatus Poseidonia sp.]|nr:hypothetical protein [Poseidonia sp.]
MTNIPAQELAALSSMSGYEQMLEIDRLCRVYSTDEASIRAALAQLSNDARPAAQQTSAPTADWDTSHKDVPQLGQATPASTPTVVDKNQFRFEYDPTREATARREQVSQAILCSGCGVALGIPDVRPIKVTCPSCMFETTYTH